MEFTEPGDQPNCCALGLHKPNCSTQLSYLEYIQRFYPTLLPNCPIWRTSSCSTQLFYPTVLSGGLPAVLPNCSTQIPNRRTSSCSTQLFYPPVLSGGYPAVLSNSSTPGLTGDQSAVVLRCSLLLFYPKATGSI